MSKTKQEREEIRRFIIENVSHHSTDIVSQTCSKFNISRQSTNRYLKQLMAENVLEAIGATRQRKYNLKTILETEFCFFVTPGLNEDMVWRDNVRPLLANISKNILEICNYGVTEMINNVIDHSESKNVFVKIKLTAIDISISVYDSGIGIFNKIQKMLNLDDKRHAILELAKGKLTTDPSRHTGEGIFFTSRAFDYFSILSSDLYFSHTEPYGDWLLEDSYQKGDPGTLINMKININSARTIKEVFDKYTTDDNYDFSRTHVPVNLARYGDENLVSRSQAKRLLLRFERFKEILLDFIGVQSIGPAFADEIFRVFWLQNPNIRLVWINTNQEVEKTIKRVMAKPSI
jgi:anti-sigma regulatory factor (Ser/Thr protein kinase)